MTVPRRGEVYWVDFDPARGSEQAGHRPAVVISLESFNRATGTCVVAAVTSQAKSPNLSVHLPRGKPTDKDSWILPFQLLTVTHSRLEGYLGSIDAEQTEELNRKLRLCWGL